MASETENRLVLTPSPRASEMIAESAKIGRRESCRRANRRSTSRAVTGGRLGGESQSAPPNLSAATVPCAAMSQVLVQQRDSALDCRYDCGTPVRPWDKPSGFGTPPLRDRRSLAVGRDEV